MMATIETVGWEHLGGCVLTGDPRCHTPKLWTELLLTFRPKTLIDIGCGAGHAVEWWLSRNVEARGVDGFAPALTEAIRRNPGLTDLIYLHDYTRGSWPRNEEAHWDMGWCCEFVEHVDSIYESCFMETFGRCRILAMTHALPLQEGYHHVNCQTAEYWIEHIQRKTPLDFLPIETQRLKGLAEPGSFASQSLLMFANRRL